MDYPLNKTYRTKSNQGRVTRHPEWCETSPWVSYKNGSAGLHFKTLEDAQVYFTKLGDPLILPTKE